MGLMVADLWIGILFFRETILQGTEVCKKETVLEVNHKNLTLCEVQIYHGTQILVTYKLARPALRQYPIGYSSWKLDVIVYGSCSCTLAARYDNFSS